MTFARRTLCVALVCLSACVVFGPSASAQQIQQDAKIAEGRLNAEQLTSVREFVEAWMGKLIAAEPADVIAGRNAVLREFRTPGISETFRMAYSEEVSKQVAEAIRSENDLVRINAMIIATQLTNDGADALIAAGLADDNAAVQYWSAKAYLQRVERATAEDGPGMSPAAQRAMIAKVQQIYQGSPSTPVARVGVEILSNLDVPEARETMLTLLHARVANHAANPQDSYLPEQTAIQLLSAEISRERRVDEAQVREVARAAFRYFVLINAQMKTGNVLDAAEPGHLAMLDWCYKCLNAMGAKFPAVTIENDAEEVNDLIKLGEWEELDAAAQRWRAVLTAAPFSIPAEDLE